MKHFCSRHQIFFFFSMMFSDIPLNTISLLPLKPVDESKCYPAHSTVD